MMTGLWRRARPIQARNPVEGAFAYCDPATSDLVRLHFGALGCTIISVRAFNIVAAVVAATILAGTVFRFAFVGIDSPSGWRVAAAWCVAAATWAVVFSFVRDGVRNTLGSWRRH